MIDGRRSSLALRCLSALYGGLGRWRRGRRLLRRIRVRQMARAWLRRSVLGAAEDDGRDGVTVVIGVRNRTDHRLANALKSLRAQTLPPEAIRTLVVDYGSQPAAAGATAELCRRHGADYLRVARAPVWSRGRCLNVGIRRAETPFLMTSDTDIVFSPDYLADAVDALRREPLSVVCAPMLDLPETSTASAKRAAGSDEPLPLETWRRQSTPRFDWEYHPSITVAHTAFYQLVRGYDEYYELWGEEDDDLMRRLRRLGLSPLPLETGSFYLHQWHPKFEGVPGGDEAGQIRRNREYYRTTHSIVRNGRDWGRPAAAPSA